MAMSELRFEGLLNQVNQANCGSDFSVQIIAIFSGLPIILTFSISVLTSLAIICTTGLTMTGEFTGFGVL